MRIAILFGCVVIAFSSSPALADEPTGDWLVADGNAQIHIENCGNALWGFVAWEKEAGRDTENPDPSKRDRPTLGLPILLNMQASTKKPGWWDGEVYNAQNGKTYTSHITLEGPDSLRIEGCVLQILCGGQTWTRVKPPDAPATPAKPAPAGKPGTAANSAKGAPSKPAATKTNYCSSVADLARASH